MKKTIEIRRGDVCSFQNHTRMCVGTGRLDLALHGEYQRQLKAVQDACHFQYIRGHGLFSDQMGIYQAYPRRDGTVKQEYCFTYLDRVMDCYLENGLRPFLELGFMPGALASAGYGYYYDEYVKEDGKWVIAGATLKRKRVIFEDDKGNGV